MGVASKSSIILIETFSKKKKKYLEEAKGPSVLELTISCALQDYRQMIQPESGKKVVYIQVARSCLI